MVRTDVAGTLQTAGDRAARDVSTSAIIVGSMPIAYGGTYALPLVARFLLLGGTVGTAGPGVGHLKRIHHIFGKAAHNLESLVQQYGSRTAAHGALERATVEHVAARGLSGQFQEVVKVGGVDVTVRGAVVNGVVKIGTAFR